MSQEQVLRYLEEYQEGTIQEVADGIKASYKQVAENLRRMNKWKEVKKEFKENPYCYGKRKIIIYKIK